MSDNDVYLFLVDDVFEELNERHPQNADEVNEIINEIKYREYEKLKML